MKPIVSIIDVDYNSNDLQKAVISAVQIAMEKALWEKFIPEGSEICLKPNLCIDIAFPGYITSPWVLEGVILKLYKHVKKLYVVESDTWTTDVERGIRESKLLNICNKYGVEWVNLSKTKTIKVHLENSFVLGDYVEVPELLTKTKIVSLPVLKTHGNTVVTGAIKNQWGCLTKMRIDFHEHIDYAMVDLNRLLKPVFSVMDGTIGCEGKGPKQGIPRVCNLVLASSDNVALDSVAAKIMGISLSKTTHIPLCEAYGTGISNYDKIEVVGKDINTLNLRFKHDQKSLLTTMDLLLRKPFLKKIFYHTPAFKLIILLAKLNYPIWIFFIGKKLQKNMLKTKYGIQWLDNKKTTRIVSSHKILPIRTTSNDYKSV